MTPSSQRRRIWPTVLFAVFFVALYLYLWLWIDSALLSVDPTLLPADAGLVPFPGFSWEPLFLSSFLAYPGGPVECLSALLSQCYYHAWAGALVIASLAALLGLAAHFFVTAVAGGWVPAVRFIPAILVLILYSQYADKLPMLVGLLLAMVAVCVYVWTRLRHPAVRLAVFLALSGIVYYAAGGAYLLYAALCGVFELRGKQGRLLGLCYLLLGGVIPYALGTHVLDLSLADAYTHLSPFPLSADITGQSILLCLYLVLLLCALGGAVWPSVAAARKRRGAVGSTPTAQTAERSPGVAALSDRLRGLTANPGVEFALVLLAAALAVVLSFDGSERSLRRIDGFAAEGMWPQVLREARSLPRERYTFVAIHAVNRALYETGRLPYEMFSYPQHPKGMMLGVWEGGWPTEYFHEGRRKLFFQLGDIELQIGLVNEAEHEAYEAQEIFADHPVILKRLAFIHIVKRQPEVARVFLRALSGDLRYGRWAQDALERLGADPLWAADPRVQQIRSVMVVRESAILDLTLDQRLDELLRTNRRNRMAFEYKMAHCLLSCQFEKLIGELPRLDDFDYPDIPRHYEEAILIYEDMTGEDVHLPGRDINPETREAFREFRRGWISLRAASDREAIWAALAERFGDTYFFYNATVVLGGTAR